MSTTAKSGLKAKIGICLLMMVMFTQSLVSPGLSAMQASFPTAPTELVQMLSTIATLFSAASILVAPGVRKIGYKKMSILTVVLMFIGALGVAVIGSASFWGVFVARIIYGIGYGFAFALCVAYCAALFDGKTRSVMFGVMTGAGGICSMIFSLVAGVLSVIDWTYSFWFMTAFIVVFGAIALFMLPEPDKQEEAADKDAKADAPKKGFSATFIIMIILCMFGIAAFTSFMNNGAMVIIDAGLGEPAVVGTVFSAMGAGMLVGGFVYGPVKMLFKRFTHPLILFLFALAFVGFLNITSIPLFAACAFVFGFAFGMLNPCWQDILLDKAPGKGDMVSSIFVATQGIGQFFSPAVLGGIATLVGFTGVYYQWQLVTPFLIAAFVIVLVLNIVNKKGKTVAAEEATEE